LIRVFLRKSKWTPDDELAFFGEPELFRPPEQPVAISVPFTWDIPRAEHLQRSWSRFYSRVELGGPGLGDPGGEFTAGLFLRKGITITSRGCIRHCPWCHVPAREGRIRELKSIAPGHIIQDNNILACSKAHVERVFAMLRDQRKAASFNGGLDARLLRPWHLELFKSITIGELWFAADEEGAIRPLKYAAKLFGELPLWKKRAYVMIGYDGESLNQAEARLEAVYDMGFLPFCQLYQPEEPKVYTRDWTDMARKWSRPAAYNNKKRGGKKWSI
jgi:hypothetical protein